MDERDQFSISMQLGLWYKLGPVMYYFFWRDCSFTQDRKNVSEKRLLKYWVLLIYGIYTHAIIYLHIWM